MPVSHRPTRLRRRPILALGLALPLGFAGCRQPAASAAAPTGNPPTPTTMAMTEPTPGPTETPVATTSVTIENFAFVPAVIQVAAGATVTWTNQDIEQHTVTARDHSFTSDALATAQTFKHQFNQAGVAEYFCEIHPHMIGHVIVA